MPFPHLLTMCLSIWKIMLFSSEEYYFNYVINRFLLSNSSDFLLQNDYYSVVGSPGLILMFPYFFPLLFFIPLLVSLFSGRFLQLNFLSLIEFFISAIKLLLSSRAPFFFLIIVLLYSILLFNRCTSLHT